MQKSKLLLLLFCKEQSEQIADSHSFVMSNLSKLHMSLFNKECMSEERLKQFAHGHKKGEKRSITYKNTNFLSELLVFLSNVLESSANHSHCLFLKSNKSDLLTSLFCKK